jgi:hypothetical protein
VIDILLQPGDPTFRTTDVRTIADPRIDEITRSADATRGTSGTDQHDWSAAAMGTNTTASTAAVTFITEQARRIRVPSTATTGQTELR